MCCWHTQCKWHEWPTKSKMALGKTRQRHACSYAVTMNGRMMNRGRGKVNETILRTFRSAKKELKNRGATSGSQKFGAIVLTFNTP